MNFELNAIESFALRFLEISALVIAASVIALIVAVVWMYVADVTQTRHTIRRNYPVLGRFRYLFEYLGM